MEPTNESSPNNSQTQPTKGRFVALAGVAIVALLLGLLLEGQFGLMSSVLPGGEQPESTESVSEVTPEEPEAEENEDNIPEGFVSYTNSEIGFRIAYPEEWGEVETEQKKSIGPGSASSSSSSGHLLQGGFTQNDSVTFGSATHDFHLGTDAPLLVGNGYDKLGGSYYVANLVQKGQHNSGSITYNNISDQNPKPISSDNGIIYDYVALGDVGPDGSFNPSGYEALFNTEENQYNGVAFRLRSREDSARTTFEQVLDTFELVEPGQGS